MTNNTPDYEDNLYFDSQNTKKDLCITSEQLTEQWKKGELPEGHYYIKTRSETNIDEYIQWYKDHGIPSEKSFAYFNGKQVLAPVPSYDELQNMNEAVNQAMAANIKLVEENKQLKELLKECEEKILLIDFDSIKIEILQKIDEALK
jgi:hypothetical protein